jgi:ubiquitin C-terminal hydrolase
MGICSSRGALKIHAIPASEQISQYAFDTENKVWSSRPAERLREMSAETRCGLVGLQNLGNTCYMNSALQCLSNTQPLTDYFLLHPWSEHLNLDSDREGKADESIAFAYCDVIQKLWLKGEPSFSPRSFRKRFTELSPRFANFEQQDAQEFLSELLDFLHERLNRSSGNKKLKLFKEINSEGRLDIDVANEAWKQHVSFNRSIIVDLFQGQLRSRVTCTVCNYSSITFDPFTSLSLPLQDEHGKRRVKTLSQALQLFTSEERLTDKNSWDCPKCQLKVEAIKKMDIWRLPPVLMIHFKRFQYNQFGDRISKLDNFITYPVADMDFSPFGAGGTPFIGGPALFDLIAVSMHAGSVNSGHYTTIAFNQVVGNWYLFDDQSVNRVTADATQSNEAYVLFYSRLEGPNKIVIQNMNPFFAAASSVSVSSTSGNSVEMKTPMKPIDVHKSFSSPRQRSFSREREMRSLQNSRRKSTSTNDLLRETTNYSHGAQNVGSRSVQRKL